jgi:hypothetical protein
MKPDHRPTVDLDAAIDRAVRSIMSAEPRAGLRQRVLSQIHEAPRRTFPVLRLAIAGGTIAAVALAVALRVANRPIVPEDHAVPPPLVASAPPREQPAVRETPTPTPVAPRPQARRSPAPSQLVPQGVVVAQSLTALEAEDKAEATPTTAPEVPQDLEALRTPALSPIRELDTSVDRVPAIAVTPLGMSRLPEIAPLQSPIR